MGRNYDRSIRLDSQTHERLKQVANTHSIPVSAWIRVAIRHELDQERSRTETSELRDEVAANFMRVLDQFRNLSNAQQAAIAILDTLAKYVLSVSPDPGPDSQRIGRRRYEQFLKSVATALQGDIGRTLGVFDNEGKQPESGDSSTSTDRHGRTQRK